MSNYLILPLVSLLIFPIVTVIMMIKGDQSRNIRWTIPAAFGVAFFAFSLLAVITEGPLGFWANHTQDFWGNQVWLDLLLAIGIAWCALVPKAKTMGMKLPFWLIFIMCSGSIGLLAMFSRWLYLSDQT
ncbi:hypothetical protein [Fretibacter rubidus]|uniref:hypothetical protein n=1 Tax=Fretibacter rubidus TaxID=570162 RepID=UPI00352A1DCC